jgi:hypothetical protein
MPGARPDLDRQVDVSVGRVDVLHRLALAVIPRDAVTTGVVPGGIRVGVDTSWTRSRRPRRRGDTAPLDPVLRFPALQLSGGAAFVLRHGYRGRTDVTVRVDDPARRWLPRRFAVPLWTAAEVEGVDGDPPTSGPIPAESRLLRPWLLPGPAYPVPPGTTGLRLTVTRGSVPLRYARIEAFGNPGIRIGWAHSDEHGQALLIISRSGAVPMPAPDHADVDVVLRTHGQDPDPDRRPAVDPGDPLADVPVEAVTRSAAPPTALDLDNDLLRGITRPPEYVTAAQDVLTTFTVGTVRPFAYDIPPPP